MECIILYNYLIIGFVLLLNQIGIQICYNFRKDVMIRHTNHNVAIAVNSYNVLDLLNVSEMKIRISILLRGGNMSISKYRAFVTVVESGNLTRAASQLGYSQPGISHMIDSLEAEMGFPLLIRNKERIIPTDNGKKILSYCYDILKKEESLRETVSSINGIMEGDINVGAFCSLMAQYIPRTVKAYSNAYSKIIFHLYEIEASAFDGAFNKGLIDIAFMSQYIPKGYTFIPLFKDKARVIMREDHPLANCTQILPHMLNGCDFIMPVPGYDDIISSIQNHSPFTPNIKYYPASDVCAISMVHNGLGISIISSLQVNQLPSGVIARDLGQNYGRSLGICVRSMKHLSPAVKELIRISKETAAHMLEENDMVW